MKLGYFDSHNREYIITNMYPTRPLKNYLFNDQIVASLDQFGFGLANAFTHPGFRPLVFDERLVYIKDKGESEYYAANRNYTHLPFDCFQCHVGVGYQKIVSEYKGLRVEYTILIPRKNLVELSQIKVTNLTDKVKDLSIYSLIKPHINVTWHTPYTKTAFDSTINGVYFSHTGFHLNEKYVHSFYRSDQPIVAFDLNERFFKGTYNDFSHPIALEEPKLSSRLISFEDRLVAALQFDLSLFPNETRTIHTAYALADSYSSLSQLASVYGSSAQFNKELEYLQQEQDQLENACQIQTADEYLNVQTNTWLKRQISLGKTWARVYGKGFRDVLQDIAAFLSFDPTLARERILNTLKYFKINGNTIRQFDPIFDEPYRDGAAWVSQTILTYIKETGDTSVLDEKIGYYDSKDFDTVFDHMVKGLNFLLDGIGKHGLCLWGGGDWNDSMNNCGTKGIGESVWLSLATIKAVNEFCELVSIAKPAFDTSSFIRRQNELKVKVVKYGMDGAHFLYGYNDEGEKVGSFSHRSYGSFYLNPQTWAVLANVLPRDQALGLMEQVEHNLKCEYGFKLVDQPFLEGTDKIGRVSYFAPGCFENGSVYLHANTFKIAADLMLGRAEQAYETLKMIRYDNPHNPDNGMEPYAISNMFLGPNMVALKGFAPQSWITGSAGWLYRNIIEGICGIKPEMNGLRIQPCLPQALKNVMVFRKFRQVNYEIRICQTGVKSLTVDGIVIHGNLVPILDNKTKHVVTYTY